MKKRTMVLKKYDLFEEVEAVVEVNMYYMHRKIPTVGKIPIVCVCVCVSPTTTLCLCL